MSTSNNLGGRPLKYKTPEELQAAIDDYFATRAYTEINGSVVYAPTITGLANSIGLTRQGLLNYAERDGFFDSIKSARDRVAEALEQRLYGSAVTGVIFNLKNNFGWKDQVQQDITTNGKDVSSGITFVAAKDEDRNS